MKIKRVIEEQLNKSVPDLAAKISEKADWENIKESGQKTAHIVSGGVRKKKFSRIGAAVAAVCCMIAVIALVPKEHPATSVGYSLILDVNPSIKFSVGADDLITAQTGLNEDGVILLCKSNFVGENVGIATEKVLCSIRDAGLLGSKEIRITTVDDKGNVNKKKQSEVTEIIQRIFDGEGIKINFLDKKQLDELEDYYEDKKIGEYEKQAILKLREELIVLVRQKMGEIDNLLEILKEYEKDEEEKIIGFAETSAADAIAAFVKKYKLKLEFKIASARYEDIYEFCEELRENKEELAEGLEEINKAGEEGDYAEIFEELIDLAKEELIKH